MIISAARSTVCRRATIDHRRTVLSGSRHKNVGQEDSCNLSAQNLSAPNASEPLALASGFSIDRPDAITFGSLVNPHLPLDLQ